VIQAETRVTDSERLMLKLQQEVDRLEGKAMSCPGTGHAATLV